MAKLKAPISAAEFAQSLDALIGKIKKPHIAVGVSGGPDSMALCLLAQDWAKARGGKMLALHVNHGYREEAAVEAQQVKVWLKRRGIRVKILKWHHTEIKTARQEKARDARYALLQKACVKNRIGHLLLAHQAEDQAETVLMRLAKGSGVRGLAGIPAQRAMNAVQLLRPLLDFPKARLIQTCKMAGQEFLTDPSNNRAAYARGRLRRVLPLLVKEGMNVESLCRLAQRMQAAGAALQFYENQLYGKIVKSNGAEISLSLSLLRKQPQDMVLRLLNRAIEQAADNPPLATAAPKSPIKYQALQNLWHSLKEQSPAKAKTIGGVILRKQNQLLILTKEPPRRASQIGQVKAGKPKQTPKRAKSRKAKKAGVLKHGGLA